MLIEIWTDLGCPWCYIGEQRLETALAQFEHRDGVQVVRHSWERDPGAPVGGESASRNAEHRFGVETTRAMGAQVRALAEAEGLPMDTDKQLRYNTVDAHRVLHLALDPEEGGSPERQAALYAALEHVHFTAGADFSDREQLADAAQAAGFDRALVVDVLESGRYLDRVRRDVADGTALGVSAVPTFVLDRRFSAVGAPEVTEMGRLLQQAWDARAEASA